MAGSQPQGKRWTFTIFVDDYYSGDLLVDSLPVLDGKTFGDYGGAQLELCPTTARYHIQGFCGFATNRRLRWLKDNVHASAHWEVMLGTLAQNKKYCSKSDSSVGQYKEWGQWPENNQGKRTDLEAVVSTIRSTAGDDAARVRAAALEHGASFIKHYQGIERLAGVYADEAVEPMAEPLWRPWQMALTLELAGPVDPRRIVWYYDELGGSGKSTMVTYFTSHPELKAVMLEGKVADMKYAFMKRPGRVVFFDLTRTMAEHMDHLYMFAEALKNGIYMNSKYESRLVRFAPCHVVFFANFKPEGGKWSADRLCLREFAQDGSHSIVGPIHFGSVLLEPPAAAAGGAGAPGGEPSFNPAEFEDLLEGF